MGKEYAFSIDSVQFFVYTCFVLLFRCEQNKVPALMALTS